MIAELEIGAAAFGVLHRRERLLARADDSKARGEHGALLRAGDGETDPPLIEPEVDAPDRTHAVDIEKRRVTRGIHGTAHRGHIDCDAGRRLVMHDHDALDLVVLILAERLL